MRGRRAGGTVTLLLLSGSVLSGLVAAGCSGTPAGQSGSSSGGTTKVVATFTAVDTAASTLQLTDDAKVLTVRLHALGDSGASAVVRGGTVVVLGTRGIPEPAKDLAVNGSFQVRPALCQAGPPMPPSSGTVATPLPSGCSSDRYSLQAPNLTVDESTGNSNLFTIPPDPVLASYPSSTAIYDDSNPESPVLVPVSGEGGVRYLLGPAELNGTAVASARAAFLSPEWIVDVTFTEDGASQWNALARKNFHEITGVDVDGRAVSAPLMQPNESTFTSFGDRMQISGNFTQKSAEQLAAILESGALATPLQA